MLKFSLLILILLLITGCFDLEGSAGETDGVDEYRFTLTLNQQGIAGGQIAGDMNCYNERCTQTFSSGSQVTLTTQAMQGGEFLGWSGSVCTTSQAECTFEVDHDIHISADFKEIDFVHAAPLEEGLNILPAQPRVSRNGALQLDTLLKVDGQIMEPDADANMSVEWTVNNSRASIDESGRIRALGQLGTAQISAKVKYAGQTYQQTVNLDIVNLPIGSIFIDPRAALMDLGDQRHFRMVAMAPESPTPVELEADKVDFQYDPRYIRLEPKIDKEIAEVQITALERGYTQVIPIYRVAGEEIKGDPLHIHIASPPQPDRNQTGGQELSLFLSDNGRDLDFVHLNPRTQEEHPREGDLLHQNLNVSDGVNANDVRSGEFALPHVFREGNELYIVALRGRQVHFLSSSNNGASWSDPYRLLFPYSHYRSQEPEPRLKAIYQNRQIHLLYFTGTNEGQLYYLHFDPQDNSPDPQTVRIDSNISIGDMDFQWSPQGFPSFVYSDTQGALNYATIKAESDGYWVQRIRASSDGDTFQHGHPRLSFNALGQIDIAYLNPIENSLALRNFDGLRWTTSIVGTSTFRQSGIEASNLLNNVQTIQFTHDRRGIPRLAAVDGDNIYYLRQSNNDGATRWHIDEISGSRQPEGQLQIAVNRFNRLVALYNAGGLVHFWNEPIDLDYRPFRVQGSGVSPFNSDGSDTWIDTRNQ